MALTKEQQDQLKIFFHSSRFSERGAVVTDLDGTAVHEYQGMTIIHREVELGLKKIYDLGRPVVINTLRFPLSVIRTFAKDWYRLSSKPIHVVLLNGSQLGYIEQEEKGYKFTQLRAFTLSAEEIAGFVANTRAMLENGVDDIVVFFYRENWEEGEIIWTPSPERVAELEKKYGSAERVVASGVEGLSALLLAQPVCMILLLVESATDKLMAYQHTKRNNFITAAGVDKLTGTQVMAEMMGFSLADAVCAGDSEMDLFLDGGGLSVHVRNQQLPFTGKSFTLRLEDYHDYGLVLSSLASMQQRDLAAG